MKILSGRSFWLFLLLTISSQLVYAQDSENQQQRETPDFSINTNFNNGYFIDQAALQLAVNSAPLDEFINPESYRLGPYDVLAIYGKNVLELNYRGLMVNASGDIILPGAGAVSVKGLTLKEAKSKIQSAFAEELNQTEIVVSVDRPRPVIVHIGGDIPNPGRYVLPAGTRYDALVSGFPVEDRIIFPLVNQPDQITTQINSRQPSVTGIDFEKIEQQQNELEEDYNSFFNKAVEKYDLRIVEVNGTDSSKKYIDLSAYYNSGIRKYNPYISDGDQVTMIRKNKDRQKISIAGAVRTPFEGTYRTDDTFQKLFRIAGGFEAEADTTQFHIFRSINGAVEKLTFSYGEDVHLQPRDRIVIPYKETISEIGSIRIKGQVKNPGYYSITEGETTLEEVLEMAGGLTNSALPTGAYLIRNSLDNRGVTSTTRFNPSLLTRSSDQYIEGFDYMELERSLNPNRMAVNISDNDLIANTKLLDGDEINIPKDENTVVLMGQINQPGFYNFNEELSVQDYINNADGFTVAANRNRVFIIKAGSRSWYKPEETDINSGDIILIDRTPFEDVSSGTNIEIRKEELRNSRVRLILSTISTIATAITTYLAIREFNRN